MTFDADRPPAPAPEDDTIAGAEAILDTIATGAMSQAIAVAAELGLFDRLAQGPASADAVARSTGCHPPSMRRLLRALAALETCEERPDGTFALAPVGHLLRGDARDALHAYTIWWGRYRWLGWSELMHSIRTGESAVGVGPSKIGMRQLDSERGAASVFNRAMTEISRMVARGVLRSVDFSRARTVVDVGGGWGELIAAVLGTHPHLRGILLDRPHAVDGARERLRRGDVLDRCDIVAGDFFETVPAGGDVHLLKSIVHDWDDEASARLLRRCREAIADDGRILVVEQVMPERVVGRAHLRQAVADLNMLVMLGGRERTIPEFRQLLEAAGFRYVGVTPAALGYSVVEGVAA